MEKEQISLHFIDKLHVNILDTGKQINRSMVIIILLCLILISWVSGTSSLNDEITVGGLKITIDSWTIPFFFSWLLALLFIYLFGLSLHEIRTLDRIIELYEELDFKDESLKDRVCNPLEHPNICTVAFSKLLLGDSATAKITSALATYMVVIAFFVLPFFSQGIAFYRLTILLGLKWWLCVSYFFFILLMGCYLLIAVKKM
jgi:hypothetical protein